jgi:hypothetical protein
MENKQTLLCVDEYIEMHDEIQKLKEENELLKERIKFLVDEQGQKVICKTKVISRFYTDGVCDISQDFREWDCDEEIIEEYISLINFDEVEKEAKEVYMEQFDKEANEKIDLWKQRCNVCQRDASELERDLRRLKKRNLWQRILNR